MNEPWFYALWAIGAYLLGSISTGDTMARLKSVDIRSTGTGNPGAANVFHQIGPAYGVAVFCLDSAKGIAATLPLFLIDAPTTVVAIATGAVLAGHLYPVPWKSAGGTGMAVAFGTATGLLPMGVMIAFIPSTLSIFLTRSTGYTGAVFFVITGISGWLVHRDEVALLALILAAVAVRVKALVQYRRR